MNRERMTAILEAYGAESTRWPEAERVAALTWVETHPEEFAAIAKAEVVLDELLALDDRDSGGDAALVARVLAAAPGGGNGDNVLRPVFGRRAAPADFWRQATALAACAVLGLAIGFANAPAQDDASNEMDAAFSAAFQMPGADLVDGVDG
jgi:hypothetical protein